MYSIYRSCRTSANERDAWNMSGANKQMNNRRLPPLPGGNKRGNSPHYKQCVTSPTGQYNRLMGPGPISPKIVSTPDMVITGR
jgi:hypothetical protein